MRISIASRSCGSAALLIIIPSIAHSSLIAVLRATVSAISQLACIASCSTCGRSDSTSESRIAMVWTLTRRPVRQVMSPIARPGRISPMICERGRSSLIM